MFWRVTWELGQIEGKEIESIETFNLINSRKNL
jgi:hypothetical protein